MFNYKNLKTSILAGLIVAFAVALVGCGSGNTDIGEYDVDGNYSISIESGDNAATVFTYSFSKSDSTFSEIITLGDNSEKLLSGQYQVDSDNNQVVLTDTKGNVQVFRIYKQYLVVSDFVYKGDRIAGDTIDGMYIPEGESEERFMAFKKDKTFMYNGITGTYEVKGDFVKMKADDGSSLVDLLICEDGLSNAYFIKE